MNIEYEATFTDVNKDKIRNTLSQSGAQLLKPEFLQKRTVFNLPKNNEIKGGWLRVRDEDDKITLSLKTVMGERIEDQREICLTIDDYQQATLLLTTLGAEEKAYQETMRELWMLDGVEITIDTWPFLEPFVEIEGKNEECVRTVAERLGFEWNSAKFCAVDTLYAEKYNITKDRINNHTPKILFDMENPFLEMLPHYL